MRKSIAFAVISVLIALVSVQSAHASQVATTKTFGIGGMLGAPTGLSMKYFFHKQHAIFWRSSPVSDSSPGSACS